MTRRVVDDCHNEPHVISGTNQLHFGRAALEAAKYAADVANYCDHAEHNERLDQAWLMEASGGLCALAAGAAARVDADILVLYADRLHAIEAKSVHHRALAFDGAAAARHATTWRELQLVQIDHDRAYHPDVFGLTKAEQLRHYSLHLAKLAGAFARAADGEIAYEDMLMRRLPDTLLFGMKIATTVSFKLPDERLSALPQPGWTEFEDSISAGMRGRGAPNAARSAP